MSSEPRKINSQFTPVDFQKPLPISKIISKDTPSEEKVEFDVVFIGAGPASLSGAIKLAQLVRSENDNSGGKLGEVSIGVLEKSAEIGNHILSGAVIKLQPFLELFPDLTAGQLPFRAPVKSERVYFLTSGKAIRIPVPPPMRNQGNYIASLSEVTRWMAEKAEGLGVQIFTGFPAESLLVRDNSVMGINTAETGLERDGSKSHNYQPATEVTGKVVVLGEGTRGSLTQAYLEWQNVGSENPQIYALGIKEIWQTAVPLDSIVHTLGWPLPRNVFGGSFMYPLESNLIALGLVVGLDYENANLDCHFLFQQMKTHPFFRKYLENGEMVEWGAKTIPEGGYYSIPSRLTGDGVVIIGDSAGFVDVPSLKGIHYAVKSGMLAAAAVFDALKRKDYSRSVLSQYDKAIKESFITKDLWNRRNMRLVFKQGFYAGSFKAGLM
ncbi:MAG: NAD(P)/FAD-dependent oxidoreductase, partial [candidate division Zixibacteria bacterium]|nr:NAD(P)/FAD-dependent oxidoreductase [candidate division Zixibacteria bacterium]